MGKKIFYRLIRIFYIERRILYGKCLLHKKCFFSVNKEEKEVLQKAHDIIEGIRHDWNTQDDNALDNDDYWELENAVNMLENLFKCKKGTE